MIKGFPTLLQTSGVARQESICHDSIFAFVIPSITIIFSKKISLAKNTPAPKAEAASNECRLRSPANRGINAILNINAMQIGVYGMMYFW